MTLRLESNHQQVEENSALQITIHHNYMHSLPFHRLFRIAGVGGMGGSP